MTVLTMTSKDGEDFCFVVCDSGCGKVVQFQKHLVESLPVPWRIIELDGWYGEFHACGSQCEVAIRDQCENKGKP